MQNEDKYLLRYTLDMSFAPNYQSAPKPKPQDKADFTSFLAYLLFSYQLKKERLECGENTLSW
jgi:hypothetical protein